MLKTYGLSPAQSLTVWEDALRILRDTSDEYVNVEIGDGLFAVAYHQPDIDEDGEETGTTGLVVNIEDLDGDEADGGGHVVELADAYDEYCRTGNRAKLDAGLEFLVSLIPNN